MAYIQDWGMRVQAQPQINTTRRAFLHLSQNENGRMLNIRITDVNIPSGSTAVLAGTKPDGTVYSQAGTLSGNTATFAEDVQMTAVAGTWDAKITVTNGGNCICTARITITIDPDTVAGGAVPSDSQLDGIIAECRAIADSVRKEAYGSPLVADAVEDMTDQSRVYVYTGSESGMTAGHWYYYNGTAWADGGVYNAVAVDTDTTLTIAGKAADAKEVGDQITDLKEDFTAIVNSAYITDSASGAIAHFENGADDVPMKSVKVNIAPVQSGSGDPSPSNVRAISGWDSVKVTKAGKNLLVYPYSTQDSRTQNGITFEVHKTSDGRVDYVSASGTATEWAYFNFNTWSDKRTNAKSLVGKTLKLTGCPKLGNDNKVGLMFQYRRFGSQRNIGLADDFGEGSNEFSVPSDMDSWAIYIQIAEGTQVSDARFYPMLRFASDTDDNYEPYNGNTYNISLSSAGTVYGGTLDVTSGELTVNRAIVDLGSLTWSYIPDYKVFSSVIRGIKDIDDTRVPNAISSAFTAGSWTAVATDVTKNAMFCFLPGYNQVRFRNVLYNDAATFKAAMDGVKLCYELATPITYNLTPTEVKSLLGINNVWSDAGDVDVEYRADTKLYIDKRLGV